MTKGKSQGFTNKNFFSSLKPVCCFSKYFKEFVVFANIFPMAGAVFDRYFVSLEDLACLGLFRNYHGIVLANEEVFQATSF
jgi:hypothetical protein